MTVRWRNIRARRHAQLEHADARRLRTVDDIADAELAYFNFGGAHRVPRSLECAQCAPCRLTVDMSGGRRRGALAARCNMKLCASRPRCLAGGRRSTEGLGVILRPCSDGRNDEQACKRGVHEGGSSWPKCVGPGKEPGPLAREGILRGREPFERAKNGKKHAEPTPSERLLFRGEGLAPVVVLGLPTP